MIESETASVETLHARIAALVVQRQTLRAQGAGRDELERNRLQLLQTQWDLAYALIARNLPAGSREAA